jgi:hypothetical protein
MCGTELADGLFLGAMSSAPCTATIQAEPHQEIPTRVPPPRPSPTTSSDQHLTPIRQLITPFTQPPHTPSSSTTRQDGALGLVSRTLHDHPERCDHDRQLMRGRTSSRYSSSCLYRACAWCSRKIAPKLNNKGERWRN